MSELKEDNDDDLEAVINELDKMSSTTSKNYVQKPPADNVFQSKATRTTVLISSAALVTLFVGSTIYFVHSADKSGQSSSLSITTQHDFEELDVMDMSLQRVQVPKMNFFLQFVADNSRSIIIGSVLFGVLVIGGSLIVLFYFKFVYYQPQLSDQVPQQSKQVIEMFERSKLKDHSANDEEEGGGWFGVQWTKYLWLLPHLAFLLYISCSTAFVAWREPDDRVSVIASILVFIVIYAISLFTFDSTNSFYDFFLSFLSHLKWSGFLILAYFVNRLIRGNFANVLNDLKMTLYLFKNFVKILFPFYLFFYILQDKFPDRFKQIKEKLGMSTADVEESSNATKQQMIAIN